MTLLLLVRHGETAWNAERRLQGRRDVPLSGIGRAQIRALAPKVAAGAPTAVVASPLLRSQETATLLGHDEVVIDERWQEADLGAWTGRTREALIAVGDGDYAAWRAGRYTPPGSEPLPEMRERVAEALDDLRSHERVLVVTHGGPIRAACTLLVGLPPAHLVPVLPGSLTVFDLSGTSPRLRAYNVTGSHQHANVSLSTDPPD